MRADVYVMLGEIWVNSQGPGESRYCATMTDKDTIKLIEEGKEVTERLIQDLSIAQSSWAHFEAINGKTEDRRRQFHDAGNWLRIGIRGLRGALVRDTILSLCRISDQESRDCLTLCKVSRLLQDKNLQAELIQSARSFMEQEAERCDTDIQFVLDRVPVKWKEAQLKNFDLRDCRNDIKRIRDTMLAHAGDRTSVEKPEIDLIRKGMETTSALVRASQRIFLGSAPTNSLGRLIKHANRFWDYAEVGFIEAAQQSNEPTASPDL